MRGKVIALGWEFSDTLSAAVRKQYVSDSDVVIMRAYGQYPGICGMVRYYANGKTRGCILDLDIDSEVPMTYSDVFNTDTEAKDWVDEGLLARGIVLIEHTNIASML